MVRTDAPTGSRNRPAEFAGMPHVRPPALDAPGPGRYTHRNTRKRVQRMRTNVELDAALVREAQELSRIKTKRALIHQALTEFVNH